MRRIFTFKVFRYLLLASFGSELGSWIQLAGSDWFVTGQTLDPLQVSLLGAAMNLPTFLFGIPAGVMADILGRRRMLLIAQLWMVSTAIVMTVMLKSGALAPPALILLTFFLYSGMAMQEPALYATFPEVVPRDLLPTAVTLHGAEWASARVLGPIVGGAMMARWGIPSAFFANVVSYFGLIAFLLSWKPEKQIRSTSPRFLELFQEGLRLIRTSGRLRRILMLSGLISLGGMPPLVLTPLLARTTLHVDSKGFGLLMSCLGFGSLLGTLASAGLIRRFSATTVGVAGLVLAAGAILAQSVVHTPVRRAAGKQQFRHDPRNHGRCGGHAELPAGECARTDYGLLSGAVFGRRVVRRRADGLGRPRSRRIHNAMGGELVIADTRRLHFVIGPAGGIRAGAGHRG